MKIVTANGKRRLVLKAADLVRTGSGRTASKREEIPPIPSADNYFVHQVGDAWYISPKSNPNIRGRSAPSREVAEERLRATVEMDVGDWHKKYDYKIANQDLYDYDDDEQHVPDADVDAIADLNWPHDNDPVEGEEGNRIYAGDIVQRVVWDVERGDDIEPNELGMIGLAGDSRNVGGLHFGDADYWRERLNEDYGREGGDVINIIVAEGDRIMEDRQYATDPDTGEKAYSAILLTSRKVLRYGIDWVFSGEKFQEGNPV